MTATPIEPTMQPQADSEPQGKFALGVCVLIMLLHLVDGLDMQLLGVTVNALRQDWDLPLSAFSAAMAAGHFGAAVGAVVGGLLGDRLGRKTTIIGGVLLFALATFAMAFAGSPGELAAMRFVAGIGLGGCLPPALALLADSMPPRHRGLAISLVMLCFPLGIALAGLLAIVIIPHAGWEAMFLAGAAIALVMAVILFLGLSRSPRRSGATQASGPQRGALSELLAGGERGKLLPLLGMFICCYFATNMLLAWLPALMANSGAGAQVASGAISIWSFAGMGGVLVSGLIMARWGIRSTVVVYLAGGIIALASLAIAAESGAAGAAGAGFMVLLGFGGFMFTGTISTIFAYCTDIFASHIRSSAIGMVATAGRVGAIAGSAAGASLLELGGASGFFATGAAMFGASLLLYGLALRGLRRSAA